MNDYRDNAEANVLEHQKLLIDESHIVGRNLNFEPTLEKSFISSHSLQHSTVRVFGLLFLALFSLPSTLFEVTLGTAPSFAAHALPYQLILIVIPCCAAAALTFATQGGLPVRLFSYLAVLISCFGWVVLSHIGRSHHVDISYLLPSGVLLVSAGLMHFTTRPIVVISLLVSAGQFNAISISTSAGYSGASMLTLCLIINLVSCLTAWYNELGDRRMWLGTLVLQQKASIDELTKLLNRRGFWHHFSRLSRQAARTDARLSLMLLSVDDFGVYQRHYGYAAADAALVKITEILSPTARRPFDLIARLDAGTYAICWYQAEPEFITTTVDSILSTISQLELEAPVSASIGCLVSSSVIGTPENLIETAGELLQEAQNQGGNNVVSSAF